MSAYLTAAEAAATLGISVPTLYSYVSRGMLSSAPEPTGKRRLYRFAPPSSSAPITN